MLSIPRERRRHDATVLLVLIFCSLSVALVGACSPGRPPVISVKTDMTQLFGIDWIDKETLVVEYSSDGTAAAKLGTVPILGGNLVPLPITVNRECQQVRLANPHRMWDGGLAATFACSAPLTSDLPDRVSVLHVAWPSADFQEIGLVGDTRDSAGQIATSPDGSRQLVALGSLCGFIVEATPSGAKPLSVEVADGSNRFRLDDIAADSDCSVRGWADFPAWSPDGTQIAFFAAPAAIGLTGPARGDVSAVLYVMEPDSTSAASLLREVKGPRGLAYSPDGRYVAFGGNVGGQVGLWVLDRETKDLRMLAEAKVEWFAWSPDGKRIAVIEPAVDEPPFPSRIVVIDAVQR